MVTNSYSVNFKADEELKETEPVVIDPILDTLLADTFDPALDLPGTVPEPVLKDPLVKKVGEFNV